MALTSLQNQFISSSFGQLVQISGSALADGDGNYITGSLLNISASYAADALNAQNATAASSAISASHALKADTVISASYAATASLLLGSVVSASYAAFATTASYALNAASAVNTSSLLITASAVDATITFTKGDASTFPVTVNNVVSSSYAAFATTAQDAEDLYIQVKNTSGSPIAKGDVLHATGVTGENFNVELADSTDPSKMPAFAIANEAIAINASGQAIVSGRIIGISTTGLTAGSNVYVNASGGFTGTKPTGSSLIQNIGIVGKVDGTDGELVVIGSGRSNDVPNITENYLWVGNSDSVATPTDKDVLTVGTASLALDVISSARLNVTDITASNATFTSASIGYLQTITGSAKIIGDAFIILNNDTPTERYAGIVVQDSGSGAPNTTASFEWDGQTNDWFYHYEGDDPTDFAVAMFGPEYTTKGSPVYPTNNRLLKGDGGHHANDSSITDDGATVSTTLPFSSTQITASVGFKGDLDGQASTAISASHAVTASFAQTVGTVVSASYAVSSSLSAETKGLASGATATNFTVTGSFDIDAAASSTVISILGTDIIANGNTASIDCSLGNVFYIDYAANGSAVRYEATNISPGQTINILLSNTSTGNGPFTWSDDFYWSNGTAFEPTVPTSGQSADLLSFVGMRRVDAASDYRLHGTGLSNFGPAS